MGSGKTAAVINVTPMIDILLVLLITFMLLPNHSKGLPSEVPEPAPESQSSAAESAGYRAAHSQGPFHRYRFAAGAPARTRCAASDAVRQHGRAACCSSTARRELEYADVASVIDIARGAGWNRVGLLTERIGAVNGIVGNMNGKYYRENEWWVSPYNFVPEVTSTFQLPARVSIHDATLRDGEQTPGVVFSIADKVAIAEKLAEIGVDRIEAGMPAVSEQDFQAIKEISKLGLKSKIYTFARAMNADIDKALECGCHGVIIEIPIGYPKLKYQFKWTWEDVLKKSIGVVNYAKSRGMHVVYFPYDTTRAREEDLTNLLTRLMQEAPPDSVGVVDTMGCVLPEAMKYMVRLVKSLTKLPVEVHTHNDFGMAVATELAGVEAGRRSGA